MKIITEARHYVRVKVSFLLTQEAKPHGHPRKRPNVSVSFEKGGCEHVPATEPLKRFFDSGYHYLCFKDLRRPDNLFVLCPCLQI